MGSLEITIGTQLVLGALLTDPSSGMYGLEIGRRAGLPSGAVHPVLARLEAVGRLVSGWEDVDSHEIGEPARRCYYLTARGTPAARAAVVRARRPASGRGATPVGDRP